MSKSWFTDVELAEVVASGRAGIIYLRSPGMPLSVQGWHEIGTLSSELELGLTVLEDPLRPGDFEGAVLASEELFARGAGLHYPWIFLYSGGSLLNGSFAGYRPIEQLRTIILDELDRDQAAKSATIVALEADTVVRVEEVLRREPPKRPGFYFRYISESPWIAYYSDDGNYVWNYQTGVEWPAPGTLDPVPSYDGRLFSVPGLRVFDMRSVLEPWRGLRPFEDLAMSDEYQTIAPLDSEGSHYRVLTNWYDHVRIRDYLLVPEVYPIGAPTLLAVSDPHVACANEHIALAVLSQDGSEIAALDLASQTTKIFAVNSTGDCQETEDLGIQTGKVSFSPDGQILAFASHVSDGRIAGEPFGPVRRRRQEAVLFFRDRRTFMVISGREETSEASNFPQFISNDTLIYLHSSDAMPDQFVVVRIAEER